jgi:WD40 repeat protein
MAQGPQSYVTAVAFDPTGDFLYAGGWDKVVHVWQRHSVSGQFELRPDATFRLPIGPGLRGAINTLAVSPGGKWLAVAGHGIIRGGADFRRPGRVVPAEGILTEGMRQDEGVIYVFDTESYRTHVLRGHAGAVLSMAFAPGSDDTPVLVSSAREWQQSGAGPGRFAGAIRVWDVLGTEQPDRAIASQYFPEPSSRPGLAVQRVGDQLNEVLIASAWGDDQFRIWNVANNNQQSTKCGRYANTVAALSGNHFLTGVVQADGRLEVREPLDVAKILPLDVPGNNLFYFPRALAAAQRENEQEVAVAVVRIVAGRGVENPNNFVLQLAPFNDDQVAGLAGQSTLWKVPPTGALPAVAISAVSDMVAVAGDADQSIWIYRFEDIQRSAAPFQVLTNAGSNWQSIEFVVREGKQGLLLRGSSEQTVFDLEDRVGLARTDGWRPAADTATEWKVETRVEQQQRYARILHGGREISRIGLAPQEAISTFAILAAATANQTHPAIIALGSHELGQPTLRLYNAETGEAFRALTGHTQTIRKLSFSVDGRLLASVAGDQTICIWDLSSIDRILGRHGMLPGVIVGKAAGDQTGVVVSRVAPMSVYQETVRAGDVLQSLTVADSARRWQNVREFFDVLWSIAPATEARLRVIRDGTERAVPIRVGQGVDEQKPMLNLFISSTTEGQQREWIAWTPVGPYEASSRDAESWLGWHFNTGDPNNPTRFAAADEYRRVYYRRGLIQELTMRCELALRRHEPPAAITVQFDTDAAPERLPGGEMIVRRAPKRLDGYISGFPPELVDAVQYLVDGQPLAGRSTLRQDAWSADIESIDWPRGPRRVRVVVKTNETPPRQFTHEMSVTQIPLPPSIESDQPSQQVVEQSMFRVAANVVSTAETQSRLMLNGRLEARLAGARIDRQVMLIPGNNVVEIISANAAAGPQTRDRESSRRTFRVIYKKAKSLPPEIELVRFEVPSDDGATKSVWSESEPDALTVSQPSLTIHGRIRSNTPVTEATIQIDREVNRQRLAIEPAAAGNAWTFIHTVALRPGRQEFGFFARADDSDEAARKIRVTFVPPLPQVALAPIADGNVIQRDAGDPSVELQLAAQLTPPRSTYPFEAQLLVNDEVVGAPKVDADTGELSGSVQLRGGANRIRVSLANEWGAQGASETRLVEYQRLPRILESRHSQIDRQPFTDIVTRVATPTDLPLSDVAINGRHLDASTWKKLRDANGTAIYEVNAQEVPLEPGINRVEIVASNTDGSCRKPAFVEATYDAVHWRPAQLTFLNAAPSSSVTDASYELLVRADSPSPLRSAYVEVNRRRVPAADIRIAEPGDQATQRWQISARLNLQQGVNKVTIYVANEGGEASEEREINYVAPPVRVRITSLEPAASPDGRIRPRTGPNNELVFAQPATKGNAWLRGVVQWSQADADRTTSTHLRIWVNGFQQVPVLLEVGQTVQQFEAPIVLSEAKDNRITLDLDGAPSDSLSRLSFSVDCLEPVTNQRLHLLTIGVNQQDSDSLRQRALKAIGAEVENNGRFALPLRAPGFPRVNVYRPLIGRVTFSDVFRLLLDVRADLQVPLARGAVGGAAPINDVVMLYYEGGLLVPDEDFFILSTSQEYDRSNRFSAISSEWLGSFFDSMRGAQLAFLDVATPQPDSEIPMENWNHDSHAALLCYTWPQGVTPPTELRLIDAVERALAAAQRLGELDQILASISVNASELDYSRVLPERMKSLVLTRP